MSWVITGTSVPFDNDAWTYIRAVEIADGQILEQATRNAITNFVIGCKADGIWPAIKASCILAGARTLAGSLVPLVGTAPTNVNFVSGDYNRKTGLVGDGSTKYLDSNRAQNADPQNNAHLSVYVADLNNNTSTFRPFASNRVIGTADRQSTLSDRGTTNNLLNISINGIPGIDTIRANGFVGASRSTSASFSHRSGGVSGTTNTTSAAPLSQNTLIYARPAEDFGVARLAFYSIGESLNLALLDARVTTLINAFAAAIP
jgi:hypothetical protein